MNAFKLLTLASAIGASLVAFEAQAEIGTKVQYSTTGTGVYDVTGITSFDWVDDSSLVIRDAPVATSNGTATLADFFGGALDGSGTTNVGDTITFSLYYQSFLTGMTSGSPVPDIDIDGAGAGDGSGFQVTTVLTASETAEVVFIGGTQVIINFTSISGSYEIYHNATGTANLVTGAGFTDGTKILSGTLGLAAAGGTFTGDSTGAGAGSTFLKNTITAYDSNYLQADPLANQPLVGTTTDTTINLNFNVASPIAVGSTIGVPVGYTVQDPDLILSADATYDFQANPIPEPGVTLLLGIGLAGMAATRKYQKVGVSM